MIDLYLRFLSTNDNIIFLTISISYLSFQDTASLV